MSAAVPTWKIDEQRGVWVGDRSNDRGGSMNQGIPILESRVQFKPHPIGKLGFFLRLPSAFCCLQTANASLFCTFSRN